MHTDVCSQSVQFLGGYKYFVTLIDDHTRYCRVFFIKPKSGLYKTFKKWLSMPERETKCKLKVLLSDNGVKYTPNAMKEFILQNGIVNRLTAL